MAGRVGILAACMVVLLGAGGSEHVDASSPSDFCARPVLRDYEGELKGLPAVTGIPDPGVLPMGPPEVESNRVLRPENWRRIAVAGGVVGYAFHIPPVYSGWSVESRLVRAGSLEVAAAAKSFLSGSSTTSEGIALRLPQRPGPYRYEVSFADQSGNEIARYAEYVAVVKPKVAVRLSVQDQSYSPGEAVAARLENRGGEALFAGGGLYLYRRVGSHWRYLLPGPRRGFPATHLIGAGAAGGCLRFRLPKALDPGVYRFAARMVPARLGTSLGVPGELRRFATFKVTEP